MFAIFKEEMGVTICMVGFFLLSILSRILLGRLYRGMIRETDNMATTKNKLLKQCKLKFTNCYQMNKGVPNIPIFVDKFLSRLSVGPFSFEFLYHLSGQLMLLSVVCSGIGVGRSILAGRLLGEILPFYIASFLGLYLYFSITSLVDIKNDRRVLKINLVDYLENHLSSRIEVTEKDVERLFGRQLQLMPIGKESKADKENRMAEPSAERKKAAQEAAVERRRAVQEAAEAGQKGGFTEEQEQELGALLSEFLTSEG